LLTVSNVWAQNITYERQTSSGVLIVPDDYFWYQSNAVTNLTLINCTFIDTNFAMQNFPGDIMIAVQSYDGNYLSDVQVHANISILQSTFIKSNNHSAVYCGVTDGLVIKDNQILYYGATLLNETFTILSSTNVEILNNTCKFNDTKINC